MRTAAILPVKRFAQAKQRLGESGVGQPLRAELARAMVGDVLVALGQASGLERTIVVTNEPSAAASARHQGARVVADSAEEGQSAAVALGVARALAEGFERVLCVPGDCPALDPVEIDALLAAADARADEQRGAHGGDLDGPPAPGDPREVVIVPDRHGTGTNGLLLRPPDAIAPSFGPGSCRRHRGLAAAAAARCLIERPASLLLDVDTGADLAALRERLAQVRDRAPGTRTALGLASGSGTTSPAGARAAAG